MHQRTETADYSYLANCLEEAGVELSAAECHGMMTGMICGASRTALAGVMAAFETECSPELSFTPVLRGLMDGLLQTTVETLDNLEFDLLLPVEPMSLLERFVSFQQWCRGFLFGLGVSGVQEKLLDEPEIKEGLNDLMVMAHANEDQIDTATSEENEQALVECREYCRVVVMTIYAQRFSHASGDAGTATVH